MHYCTLQEYARLGGVVESNDPAVDASRIEFLEGANDFMAGYIRAGGHTMLEPGEGVVIPKQLKRIESHIASFDELCDVGFDPTTNADSNIVKRYELAISWLENVVAKRIEPFPIVNGQPQDGDVQSNGPAPCVETDDLRGW